MSRSGSGAAGSRPSSEAARPNTGGSEGVPAAEEPKIEPEAEPAAASDAQELPSSAAGDADGAGGDVELGASARREPVADAAGGDDETESADSELPTKPRVRKLPAELPEGAKALFISGPSQEIFHCVVDTDVSDADPFKRIPKDDIVADFKNRAAVCDFQPLKPEILKYAGDEILVIMDREYKFGENFVVCLTEEAQNAFLQLPTVDGDTGGEGAEGSDEEDDVPIPSTPVPRPWENLGSDKEVLASQCKNERPLLSVSLWRKRQYFGAPTQFSDSDFGDNKVIEYLSEENKNQSIKIMEQDKGVQAIPEMKEVMNQTNWAKKVNIGIQYEARVVHEKLTQHGGEPPLPVMAPSEFNNDKEVGDVKMIGYVEAARHIDEHLPMVLSAIQQNEVMDVFVDDYKNLPHEEGGLGAKSDNALKEYQSFTDLKYSRDRTSTCVRWHPTIKGLLAVAYGHALSFDERVEKSATIRLSQSLILLWSFSDPIHPLLLLEAPEDVTTFDFCPTHPNIVAAGCISGQLVLWDLSEYDEKLRNHMTLNKDGKAEKDDGAKMDNTREREKNFFDRSAKAGHAEAVLFHITASLDGGHENAITELVWLPPTVEFDKTGHPFNSKLPMSVQLITTSSDGYVSMWDLRPAPKRQNEMPKKDVPHPADAVLKSSKKGGRMPATIKHLNNDWKPFLRLEYDKPSVNANFSPYKLATRLFLGQESAKIDDREIPLATLPPPNCSELTQLDESAFNYYIGTEDGEVVYASFPLVKDPDSPKWISAHAEHIDTSHTGPISSVERSPFFDDIVLSVSEWTFALWKERIWSGPLMHSRPSDYSLTVGKWSPTRPGVFFIGKSNGTVEVWDLLDKSHAPSLIQNISAMAITTLVPRVQKGRKKQVLVAIGDRSGTLHIVELPWSLAHCAPTEKASAQAFFDREVEHQSYMQVLLGRNAKEMKARSEAEDASKAEAEAARDLAGERKTKMKQEYKDYMSFEHKLLVKLGVIQEPVKDT